MRFEIRKRRRVMCAEGECVGKLRGREREKKLDGGGKTGGVERGLVEKWEIVRREEKGSN